EQHSRVVNVTVTFDQPVSLDVSAITMSLHMSDVRINGVLQPAGYGSLPSALVLTTTDNITWTIAFGGNTDDGVDGLHSLKDGVYDLRIDAAKVHSLGALDVTMDGSRTT